MRPVLTMMLGLAAVLAAGCKAEPECNDLKLWYDEPAVQWVEALPVGNGRLGAMVFGDPASERLQLKEETVWAGQPNSNANPDAKEAIPRSPESCRSECGFQDKPWHVISAGR